MFAGKGLLLDGEVMDSTATCWLCGFSPVSMHWPLGFTSPLETSIDQQLMLSTKKGQTLRLERWLRT